VIWTFQHFIRGHGISIYHFSLKMCCRCLMNDISFEVLFQWPDILLHEYLSRFVFTYYENFIFTSLFPSCSPVQLAGREAVRATPGDRGDSTDPGGMRGWVSQHKWKIVFLERGQVSRRLWSFLCWLTYGPLNCTVRVLMFFGRGDIRTWRKQLMLCSLFCSSLPPCVCSFLLSDERPF
jgi:hypothetical protein